MATDDKLDFLSAAYEGMARNETEPVILEELFIGVFDNPVKRDLANDDSL